MKAIVFSAPIPTYLLTRAAGRISDTLLVGPHACTRFTDIERPTLPGPEWVRVRTRLGGICGSDLSVVTLSMSPSTSPFSSFPFVLGHENVGDVVETGAAAGDLPAGTRVIANPLLCCEPRAVSPPCAACASGQHQRCTRLTDGALPPGMLIGTTRGVGGSWGEEFVAHRSQLIAVPDAVSDEEAVLVEPFAVSLHAVLANRPRPGERALVISAGSIGLLTLAALRAVEPECAVTVLARHGFQGEMAQRLGAARVVMARGDYLEELAHAAGTRLLTPILGERIGLDGFDQSYVCIGGRRGMEDGMRFTRLGGTIVLLGGASTLNGVDWTPLWTKEQTLRGSLCYGAHAHAPAGDAFRGALELIADGRAPIRPLLTHVFPLHEYRRALAVAMDKVGAGSIKVAFRP